MGQRNRTKARVNAAQPTTDDHSPDAQSLSYFSHTVRLNLLVFVAGAVLMGLEIASSRVLAPHFGNSVFVWGSLISVVLIALSLGYFFGGRLADKHPSPGWLNSICIVVSLLIFLIAIFARRLCGALVDAGFGEQSGPLVASMVLFLPPSVGMGMVSPFAIRLATESVSSVGRISGMMYAISTAGSIAGTLLTTFVLVPLCGVSAILKGFGLVLLAVAVLTLPKWKSKDAPIGLFLLALIALTCAAWPESRGTSLEPFEEILCVDTPYHSISVVDTQDTRLLRFDRYVESAILKYPPYRSVASYTDYFHLAFLVKPDIQSALFIGAGGGIGPRTFHAQNPRMTIDVVDIDPKVLEIARTHFFLEDDPHMRTIAKDGRMFLRKAELQYDCIILDAFTTGGRIPFHLVTREFLELCRDKMTADGVFVMNINSALNGPSGNIFQSMYRTLDSVFPNTYVFRIGRDLARHDVSTNIIFVATKQSERILPNQWADRAARYRSQSHFSSGDLEEMVKDHLSDVPEVNNAPIFSDDYAPIETMPF